MGGRREEHAAHLDRIHLLVARHQHADAGRDVRRSGRRAVRGLVDGLAEVRRLLVGVEARADDAVGGTRNRPPLASAGFVEVLAQVDPAERLDAIVKVIAVFKANARNRNPVVLGFGIEVRIIRTIERVFHVAVAGRHDLHDVRALDGFPGTVDEGRRAVVLLVRIEVFVFGIRNGAGRQMNGGLAAVGADDALLFDDAGVGAEGIVDHAAALGAVRRDEVVCQSLPAGIEEVMIEERTIVRVVRAAGIARHDVCSPGDAVRAVAVAVGAHHAGHARAVGIIEFGHPGAVDVVLVALPVFALVAVLLRIAEARRAVGARHVRDGDARRVEFGMALKNAGIHDGDLDALAVVAHRVGGGGVDGLKAPLLLVFDAFPGCLVAKLALLDIGGLREGAAKHGGRCDGENKRGFSSVVRLVCFV